MNYKIAFNSGYDCTATEHVFYGTCICKCGAETWDISRFPTTPLTPVWLDSNDKCELGEAPDDTGIIFIR